MFTDQFLKGTELAELKQYKKKKEKKPTTKLKTGTFAKAKNMDRLNHIRWYSFVLKVFDLFVYTYIFFSESKSKFARSLAIGKSVCRVCHQITDD